jgi:AI-2 transport system permease protein
MSKAENGRALTDALKIFNWKKLFFRWEVALIVILILEIVIFGSLNHRFLRVPVLLGSINDYISICIIALFEPSS